MAACRDTDPDLFFPVGTTGPAIAQIEAAKAVCRMCEAQEACLEFALATNQESGVWGGTSEEERRTLRKQWVARHRRASYPRASTALGRRRGVLPGPHRDAQLDDRAAVGEHRDAAAQLGPYQVPHDRQAEALGVLDRETGRQAGAGVP